MTWFYVIIDKKTCDNDKKVHIMTYFHVVIEIGQNFQIDISPISTWAGALKKICCYGGHMFWSDWPGKYVKYQKTKKLFNIFW